MLHQRTLAEENGMPANIVLIRHAQSLWQVLKQGHLHFPTEEARTEAMRYADWSVPLTDAGLAHAKRVMPLIRSAYGCPDAVFHSGYVRATQTMRVLLSTYTDEEVVDTAVHCDHAIRERSAGFTSGLTEDEARERYPWLQEHWRAAGPFFAQPPGGESLAQVGDRLLPFIGMLGKKYAGKTVFIVTHGGTIRCFRFLLESWSYEDATNACGAAPDNCGVTHYAFDPQKERLVLRAYNFDLLSAGAPAVSSMA